MLLVQPSRAALQPRGDLGTPSACRPHHAAQQQWDCHLPHRLTAQRPLPQQNLFSPAPGRMRPAAGPQTCVSHASAAFPPSRTSQRQRPASLVARFTGSSAHAIPGLVNAIPTRQQALPRQSGSSSGLSSSILRSAWASPPRVLRGQAYPAGWPLRRSGLLPGTAFCSSIDDPTAHPADEAASAASVGARTASPDSGAADSTDQGAGSGSSTSGAEMESQIDGESGGSDGDAGVASIPLDMPRRSMQLTFTCGKCGTTTTRMINRLAWEKGLVFAQCGGCEVWHNIRDAAGLIKEYRFKDGEEVDPADF